MEYKQIELPSNKKFGFLFFVIFLFLGAYLCVKNYSFASSVSIIIATIFLFFAVFLPDKLLYFNSCWMRFGILIGKIVSPVVLGVIFFGIFLPIGLSMRLFGRDELGLNMTDVSSYWKKRQSVKIKSNSFKDQF